MRHAVVMRIRRGVCPAPSRCVGASPIRPLHQKRNATRRNYPRCLSGRGGIRSASRNLQKSVLPPASRPAFRLRVRCWPVSGRCCCEGFGCIHAGAAGLPSGCRGGHMVEVTGFLWRRQCAGSEGMTAGDSRRHGQLRTASRASLDRAAKYRWASGRCSNRASRRMREMATLLRAARLRGRWRTRARQRSSS